MLLSVSLQTPWGAEVKEDSWTRREVTGREGEKQWNGRGVFTVPSIFITKIMQLEQDGPCMVNFITG